MDIKKKSEGNHCIAYIKKYQMTYGNLLRPTERSVFLDDSY